MTDIESNIAKKRGRKVIILPRPILENKHKMVLQQYHFKYSVEFADKLAKFAMIHLEDNNKMFKQSWREWSIDNSDMISKEIERIEKEGYKGSVEDKMYFSARYYYRKKAIKDQTKTEEDNEKEEEETRRKNEPTNKDVLKLMNEHIMQEIQSSKNCNIVNGNIVIKLTPSDLFEDYCNKHSISESEVEQLKKKYKNLYWRISKKIKESK
jgi:hypothetical protein